MGQGGYVKMAELAYYTYRTPTSPLLGTLVTTEPPDSIRQRFKYGEYDLTQVSVEEYQDTVRYNFRCQQGSVNTTSEDG